MTSRATSVSAFSAEGPPAISAGIVVVRETPAGWRVLLLRAYNYWDFPKGRIESGEDALSTARREAREETTLDDLDFAWGEAYVDTTPYGREKKVARYFLARTSTESISLPVNPELGKPEHHEWQWYDWQTAGERVADRLWPVLRWARDLIG